MFRCLFFESLWQITHKGRNQEAQPHKQIWTRMHECKSKYNDKSVFHDWLELLKVNSSSIPHRTENTLNSQGRGWIKCPNPICLFNPRSLKITFHSFLCIVGLDNWSVGKFGDCSYRDKPYCMIMNEGSSIQSQNTKPPPFHDIRNVGC